MARGGVPGHEEDYGLAAFKAFASPRAGIPYHDSGEPADFVEATRTGLICDPTPVSLATALAPLAADEIPTELMGTAGGVRAGLG